jgi:signal peptidase I
VPIFWRSITLPFTVSPEFYPVLLLVFLLGGFIVEPFRIPSNSMMPTFLTYDFLLVDKISSEILLSKKKHPKQGMMMRFQ